MNCIFATSAPINGRAVVACQRPGCGKRMYGADPARCHATCRAPDDGSPPTLTVPVLRPVRGWLRDRLDAVLAGALDADALAELEPLVSDAVGHAFGLACRASMHAVTRSGPGDPSEWRTRPAAPGLHACVTHNAGPGSRYLYAIGDEPPQAVEEPPGWHVAYSWASPLFHDAVESQSARLSLDFLIEPRVGMSAWREAIASRRWEDCRHLGERRNQLVIVACHAQHGQTATTRYEVADCGMFGGCLPDFRCTAANKTAVRETWKYASGADASDVHACAGCEQFTPIPIPH